MEVRETHTADKKGDSKMKKLTTLIATLLATVALTGAAHAITAANNWTLDLSAFGAGTYTNIDHVDLSGQSTVTQHFSNPFILQNGDTFTESGLLNVTDYYVEPGAATDINSFTFGTTYRHLYVNISNLTGTVSNVTAAGFDYTFNPGSGTIQLFLDADFNPTNPGTQLLANLSLLTPSGGHNNGVILGGAGINGTTDLTAAFGTVTPGVFFANGVDFGNLPAGFEAFGLANTNNLLVSQSSATPNAILVFNESGQFNVATAVPESGTLALIGAGLLSLTIFGKRHMKKEL